MTTKKCTTCGETKPTDQFHKCRSSRDGLKSSCKTCANAMSRAYYEANREHIAAQKRAYNEVNRDKINARQRAYNEANRDKMIARQRAYREANQDKVAARDRAYNEANRDKINARQRARNALMGNPFRDRAQEVTTRYATRIRDPWTPEEDHYVLTGPGTLMDKALQLSRTYDAVKNRAKLLRQENAA